MKIDDYRAGAKRLTDAHCTAPSQTVPSPLTSSFCKDDTGW
jgi:hypothetical protein